MRRIVLFFVSAIVAAGFAGFAVTSAENATAAQLPHVHAAPLPHVHCINPAFNPAWAHYLATHPGEHCPE